jgi:hypothetical protein
VNRETLGPATSAQSVDFGGFVGDKHRYAASDPNHTTLAISSAHRLTAQPGRSVREPRPTQGRPRLWCPIGCRDRCGRNRERGDSAFRRSAPRARPVRLRESRPRPAPPPHRLTVKRGQPILCDTGLVKIGPRQSGRERKCIPRRLQHVNQVPLIAPHTAAAGG